MSTRDQKIIIGVLLFVLVTIGGMFLGFRALYNTFNIRIDIPFLPPVGEAMPPPPEQLLVEGTSVPSNLEHYINYRDGSYFDLPIRGATGWAARNTPLRTGAGFSESIVEQLSAGAVFTVMSQHPDFLRVVTPTGQEGFVASAHSFINVPDVLPSMVFNVTNAHASEFRTNDFNIEGLTGLQLYQAHGFNERLGRESFIVPVHMSAVTALARAQTLALAQGNTIIMNEAYRPRPIQQLVVNSLQATIDTNESARQFINSGGWHLGWFISTGVSNHQRGAAVDISLARINEAEVATTGGYRYLNVVRYTEYRMPSRIHDLSPLAAITYTPVSPGQAGWRNQRLLSNLPEGTVTLHHLMLDAGWVPLASEWWHFDYLPASQVARDAGIAGYFFTQQVYSIAP